MSIIHDALKKVQQGLDTENQTPAASIFEPKPAPVIEQPIEQLAVVQKPTMKNKIKSLFILACAAAVIVASVLFISQQFQNDAPRVKNFAQASFYKLLHLKKPANPKTPVDLKPLAQFTVNPPAASKIAKPPAPVTLNIHGIMSNGDAGNLVLINDQVYQEGDEVDGAKIVKINLDSVVIDNNGSEQTIPVKN